MTKINNFYNIICISYQWLESKLVKRTAKKILTVPAEKSIWVLKETSFAKSLQPLNWNQNQHENVSNY